MTRLQLTPDTITLFFQLQAEPTFDPAGEISDDAQTVSTSFSNESLRRLRAAYIDSLGHSYQEKHELGSKTDTRESSLTNDYESFPTSAYP